MMRILVVDDEGDILESTSQLLHALGFDTAVCSHANRVLDTMRKEHPDLVLHDVRMPGLEIAAQLRAIRADPGLSHVPVILFTATLSAKEMAAAVGADDGIEKPFDPDRLGEFLHGWEGRAHDS